MTYKFVFDEQTLREALTATALAAVKGTLLAQSGHEVSSHRDMLIMAAKNLTDEGRTKRTEAVFALADAMIHNIKNFGSEKGYEFD